MQFVNHIFKENIKIKSEKLSAQINSDPQKNPPILDAISESHFQYGYDFLIYKMIADKGIFTMFQILPGGK